MRNLPDSSIPRSENQPKFTAWGYCLRYWFPRGRRGRGDERRAQAPDAENCTSGGVCGIRINWRRVNHKRRFEHLTLTRVDCGTNLPDKGIHKSLARTSSIFVDELLN